MFSILFTKGRQSFSPVHCTYTKEGFIYYSRRFGLKSVVLSLFLLHTTLRLHIFVVAHVEQC